MVTATQSPTRSTFVEESGVPLCQDPADFRRRASRLLILSSLESWLEGQRALPGDLLYNADLQDRLLADPPTLDRAIRKTARKQAKLFDPDADAHRTRLQGLVSAYRDRWDHEAADITPATPEGLDAVALKASEEGDDIESARIVHGAVAAALAEVAGYAERLDRLLDLAEEAQAPQAMAACDTFIGELLRLKKGAEDIFRDVTTGQEMVDALLDILEGNASLSVKDSPPLTRLHRLMRLKEMPDARLGLRWAVHKRLSDPRPLKGFATLDNLTPLRRLGEFHAVVKVWRRLWNAGGWFRGAPMRRVIEERISRVSGEEDLESFVASRKTPLEKVDLLCLLSKVMVGNDNQARLHRYLGNLILNRMFPDTIRKSAENDLDRLLMPGRIEALMLDAEMTSNKFDPIYARLSQIQLEHIRKRNGLKEIKALQATETEKGVFLLDLLKEGAFVRGDCRKTARRLMFTYLPDQGALETAVRQIKNPINRRARRQELQELYAEATRT